MSRDPTSPRRRRKQRDRTVGRRRASWSAHRTIVTPAGGSSSVLSSADWASSFIRSAASMIATRAATLDGHEDEVGEEVLDAPVARAPGRRSRSGGPARRARGDARRGACRARPAGTPGTPGTAARPARAVHRRPAARSSARVVLPTPSGPARSTACGAGPRTIAATAASAAAWPRVRAPSIRDPGPVRPGRSPPSSEVARRFGGASVAAALGRGRGVRGSLRLPRGARLGGRRRRRGGLAGHVAVHCRGSGRLGGRRRPGRRRLPRGARLGRGRLVARTRLDRGRGRPSSGACAWHAAWRSAPRRWRRAPRGPRRPGCSIRPTAGSGRASGRPAPGAWPRARAGRRSTARSSCGAAGAPR